MSAPMPEFKTASEESGHRSRAFYGEGSNLGFWEPILELISRTASTDELKAIRRAVQHREQELRSVAQALPHAHKRDREKASRAEEKFLRIVKLWKQGKTWGQIAQILGREFGFASADAYKKHYFRHLPIYLSFYRNLRKPNMSELDFLAWALPLAKRRPGRPKSGQKSNR
jgi:hypothetical protein